MHPTPFLLLSAAALTLANPISLADIERRWSAGETEVCRPNSPGCYLYAWVATLCSSDEASIHSGLTHRDATPAWPIQRDADAEAVSDARGAWSYATDERTMLGAQRRKREENAPLLAKMKHFVEKFYRRRGGERGVIARDAQVVEADDSAPVLKPRRGMRYTFTA